MGSRRRGSRIQILRAFKPLRQLALWNANTAGLPHKEDVADSRGNVGLSVSSSYISLPPPTSGGSQVVPPESTASSQARHLPHNVEWKGSSWLRYIFKPGSQCSSQIFKMRLLTPNLKCLPSSSWSETLIELLSRHCCLHSYCFLGPRQPYGIKTPLLPFLPSPPSYLLARTLGGHLSFSFPYLQLLHTKMHSHNQDIISCQLTPTD